MNRLFLIVLMLLSLLGCSAAPDDSLIYGADDTVGESADGVGGYLPLGSKMVTTTGVNFRKGPGTTYSVIRVLPEGTQVESIYTTSPTHSFYQVKQQGTIGWVHGAYLELVGSNDNPNVNTSDARKEILDRAKASVGFSYWWGHGRWRPEGPTSSTKGSCSGSCPNCSHGGSYGADCSGMVAKAWKVPASNDDLSSDDHPYSTGSFIGGSSQWSEISRSSLGAADALVYNNGSSGHIVLYESGDGWGTQWVYECKGCSYGCVHDLRSFSSAYHAIRRNGL